ncbi:MAG: YncE family protein [Actinomycetota bacterium]
MPVPGELGVRVASPDGSLVALMPPLPAGASPWVPEPRASTTITVADPSGLQEPRQFRLDGNFEPEAFSADRGTLFLISYVPPTAPTGYRVAALDLTDGSLSRVNTGVKGVVETMSGTRLEQVASADGSMLYTLYTTRPPDHADADSSEAEHVGFVHTLSLAEGWAHCIPLPEQLWGGAPADQAMAISADGGLLYVVDTARRVVAAMDTSSLEMTGTDGVQLAPDQEGETRAVIAPDGALVVSSGAGVVSLDAETLRPIDRWTFGAPVAALGTGLREIYVAVPGGVHAVRPGSDRAEPEVRAPVVGDLSYVGMLER